VALDKRRLDDASLQRALSLLEVREPLSRLLHELTGGPEDQVRDGAEVDHPHEDYSPQAAAERPGVSRKLVNKLIDTGQLERYRLDGGGEYQVPEQPLHPGVFPDQRSVPRLVARPADASGREPDPRHRLVRGPAR